MFWEFLKFWGGCIVTGWHIGDGIFGAVVEFCLLTSAGLFFLKFLFKRFNWKKLWKKWEEIVMKWAFILFLVSFFIAAVFVAPFLEYKKVSPTPEIIQPPKIIAKSLPVKIIPNPQPIPPTTNIPAQQLAGVETQKQFENFNEGTGVIEDAVSQIARLKAEKAAATESENRKRNLEIKKWWDVYLPYYQHSLVVLHDVLASESAKAGDGIAQSVEYFQCLPPAIDPKIGEIKAAEIRFQKNTNMDFLVAITGLNTSGHRQLKISCRGGLLEMDGIWGYKFRRNLHVYPDFEDYKDVPIDKANDLILEAIKQLVAAQILSNTNPQIHLENKQ